MTAARTVDAEVHCQPSSRQALEPYLDRYWRNYLADGELGLPSMVRSYPPRAATTSLDGEPAHSAEALRRSWPGGADGTLGILACVTLFGANRNPYYEAAFARALNDWMRAEWLEDDQFRGSMVVPTMHVDAAVDEIERVGSDPRFVQVLLPVRGHDVRYGNLRFRRIFEAAARNDLVVGLHAWGRTASAPTSTGLTYYYLEDYLSNSQTTVQAQVVSLITEGVFDALPGLRVALLECGFSWVPGLLWRFDKDWKALWREVPWMTKPPSEYFYEHFRATTAPVQLPPDPSQAREVLDIMRAREFLMFGTDHPHNHGSADVLWQALGDDSIADIRQHNATDFYRLDSTRA